MSTRSYTKLGIVNGVLFVVEDYSNTSFNSPRVHGKLKMQSNPHSFSHIKLDNFFSTEKNSGGQGADRPIFFDTGGITNRLTNEAYAKFAGSVRKDHASLGVSFASYRQSVDMIRKRATQIDQLFKKIDPQVQRGIDRRKKRLGAGRAQAEARAGDVFEGYFGWAPLVSDIQAAFGTLGRDPKKSQWIAKSASSNWSYTNVRHNVPYDLHESDQRNGTARVCIAGTVNITSENTHLANRLGLLNLPGVAWDLVPWSFVVNMFTNMGQMANSLTDFAGVSIVDGSMTFSTHCKRTYIDWAGPNAPFGWAGRLSSSRTSEIRRARSVGVPSPSFQMRVPEMDVGLAAIAVSLLLQRVNKWNRLLSS